MSPSLCLAPALRLCLLHVSGSVVALPRGLSSLLDRAWSFAPGLLGPSVPSLTSLCVCRVLSPISTLPEVAVDPQAIASGAFTTLSPGPRNGPDLHLVNLPFAIDDVSPRSPS